MPIASCYYLWHFQFWPLLVQIFKFRNSDPNSEFRIPNSELELEFRIRSPSWIPINQINQSPNPAITSITAILFFFILFLYWSAPGSIPARGFMERSEEHSTQDFSLWRTPVSLHLPAERSEEHSSLGLSGCWSAPRSTHEGLSSRWRAQEALHVPAERSEELSPLVFGSYWRAPGSTPM